MRRHPLLLGHARCGLLVVDIQEKILSVMAQPDLVVENSVKLIRGFKLLECPIFVTEQYPAGLGPTVTPVAQALESVQVLEKITFSCCGIEDLVRSLRSSKIEQIVLCGIESHVCVWQTAMDLHHNDFQTYVASDAVSSRKSTDFETSLTRMMSHGILVTTTEMVLFELAERAGTDTFKAISRLVR